ncbi:MAG: flagellin FliC5, partial [Lachnospiraceae bacterium]|nr:flagellin FliC5 [Lachnospiraceae bacterium]
LTTGNATLEALGIEDFDLGENLDIEAIDRALEKVSSMRSSGGAQTNALEYGMNYNGYTEYNMTSSVSRLEDLDMGKAVSDMKKKMTLETYAIMMQKKKQEDEAEQKARLFGA